MFGVTADEHGRVTTLSLSANELAGELPESIGALTAVQGLFLQTNRLREKFQLQLEGCQI
jgi:hypothetical protein